MRRLTVNHQDASLFQIVPHELVGVLEVQPAELFKLLLKEAILVHGDRQFVCLDDPLLQTELVISVTEAWCTVD